jgi:hypothetical protein
MVDVKIKEAKKIDPLRISEVRNIDPLTIASVQQIAPAAVHIKELNHIDPLLIESLRIDRVKNLDPVHIERLNVTHIPTVSLSLSRLPPVDLNVRRVPPVEIGINQDFDLPSRYTVHTRLLGFEVVRLDVHGKTQVLPRHRQRREQVHVHERSFADVAPVGNPAIKVSRSESCTSTRVATPPRMPPRMPPRIGLDAPPTCPPTAPSGIAAGRGAGRALRVGAPRFQFPAASSSTDAGGSSVGSGG